MIAWTWHFYAAIIDFAVVILLIKLWPAGKQKVLLTPLRLCIIGIFVSAVILLLPVYTHDLAETSASFGRVFISALHQAIQMFTLDADREILMKLSVDEGLVSRLAYGILTVELIAAPMLTFVLVVSFFEDLWGYFRYRFFFRRDAYAFSELNERSVAMAQSVRKSDPGALILFSDVFKKEDEEIYELTEKAKELNAVLLKKDVRFLKFGRQTGGHRLFFIAIGYDETENLVQALRLIDVYRNRERTWLYVFSSRIECELLLNTKDTGKLIVRRVDVIQSLVYNHLFNDGYSIFRAAKETAGGASPDQPVTTHCLVLGMGLHGTEMVKALSWFGQMPRYRMTIDAYDVDVHAEERFTARCPELMSEEYNGKQDENDACYRIRIHSGTDVTLQSFTDSIRSMNDVCYVFIALGSDTLNIRTAVALRTLFAGIRGENSEAPIIETIVYQNDESTALNTALTATEDGREIRGITNYRGTPYNIRFIGSMDEMYSKDAILNSAPEAEAVEYHVHWAKVSDREEKANELYRYGYYYRSSYSVVVHMNTLIRILKEHGVTADMLDRDEIRHSLNRLEHRRWNAYMRSEGYRHAETNNRLGNMHKDLVPFDELDPEEKDKDDYVDSIKRRMGGISAPDRENTAAGDERQLAEGG